MTENMNMEECYSYYGYLCLTNSIIGHTVAGDLILKCLDQDPESRAELDEVITHEWFCEKSGQN